MNQILLIEDDPDDRDFIVTAISSVDQAISCLPIRDCTVALKLFTEENIPQPLCIFLDLNLPKIRGGECLVAIRAIPRLANVPVVVISGAITDRDVELLKPLGVKYFIRKIPEVKSYPEKIKKILQELVIEKSGDNKVEPEFL